MSTYGPGMNSILLELEAAIKNSYMSEFEDFIKNDEQEPKENPLPSKILDCENEEMLIKALSEIDSDIEIKNMLKIEEQVYSTFSDDKENIYKTLYGQSTNRISFLIKVLQKLIKEKSIESQALQALNNGVNQQILVGSLKERVRELNDRITILQNELSSASVELEDRKEMYNKLSDKYEDLVYELEMFKGNERIFNKLELVSLFKFEEDLQRSLKVIAKIKNEKIMDSISDLKRMRATVDDSKKCIICHEHQACILLKPCNHANVCEGCSLKLTNCPIDRSVIECQEKIFL